MSEHFQPETIALHTGIHRSQFNEHSEALYLTSSFVFDSAAQAAARFSGSEPGNIYSRFTNPTVTAFEERRSLRCHFVGYVCYSCVCNGVAISWGSYRRIKKFVWFYS